MITRQTLFGPWENWDPELASILLGVQSHLRPYYKIYWIWQGKGKKRKIEEPTWRLLEVQKKLVDLFEQYELHPAAYARKGSSAIENAARHANAKHVLRIDIKNCYRSIGMSHIVNGLKVRDLSIGELRRAVPVCILGTGINTGDEEYWLPTGAPTSPILCNIALTPLDEAVQKIADREGYTYTRYIDDLHLSTESPKRKWEILDEIKEILRSFSLRPHPQKCRWMTNNDNDNLIITGVRIGQKSKVPRKYAKTVRARLNNLAMAKQEIDEEVKGCLAYIKSLDPDKHDQLTQYYERRLAYVPNNGLSPSTE